MRMICKYCGRHFNGEPDALACPECVETRKRQVVRPRTCQTCGVVFMGGLRAWYCPTCRAERKRQQGRASKERARQGKTRAIGSTSHCERCGQPYAVTGSLQRYCRACAPEATRQAANALSKAWNAKHTTPEQRRIERHNHAAPIPCRVCGRLFVPNSVAVTCGPECAAQLKRNSFAAFEATHREQRSAYQRKRHADHLAAMTDAERQEYRDKINARARENYKKRKEAKQKEPEKDDL